MDDVVTGAIDEQQAYRLYKDAKSMLRAGGFNLRKFVSNLPSLQKTIDDEEQPTASSSLKEPACLQETYSKSTLGPPKLHKDQKVLEFGGMLHLIEPLKRLPAKHRTFSQPREML